MGWAPAVGFDGSQFFVFWSQSFPDGVYGTSVTLEGSVSDQTPTHVFDFGGYLYGIAVAFDGKHYIVSYQDFFLTEGGGWFKVTTDGTVVDELRWGRSHPGVACSSSSCITAWRGAGAVMDEEFWETKSDEVLSIFEIGTSSTTQLTPCVAYGADTYLVTWDEGWNINSVRVSGHGEVLDDEAIPISTSDIKAGDLDFPYAAYGQENFMVTWDGGAAGHVTRVDLNGVVLDPLGIPDVEPNGLATIASNGDNYLVASTSLFTLISADGTVIETGELSNVTTNSRITRTAVTSNGVDYFVAWQELVNGGSSGQNPIYGMRIDGTDLSVLDNPKAIMITGHSKYSSYRYRTSLSVASDGIDFFVVWLEDGKATNSTDSISGMRIGADGTLLDSHSIVIATSPRIVNGPSVAFDGDLYFVAWDDSTMSYSDIFGSRISTEGVLLDTDKIELATGVSSQSYPKVASDGNRRILMVYQNFIPELGYYSHRARGRFIVETDDLSTGEPCALDFECLSSHCVDKVCCESACREGNKDDCLACSEKTGSESDGKCTIASSVTVCRESAGDCDPKEFCNGTGDDCPLDEILENGEDCDDDNLLTLNDACTSGGVCEGELVSDSGVSTNADGGEDADTETDIDNDTVSTDSEENVKMHRSCNCQTPGYSDVGIFADFLPLIQSVFL
jgi:hypothetical protein